LKKHLIDQNTECPPVDRSTILFVEQDLLSSLLAIVHHLGWTHVVYLWCHEFGGTAESASRGTEPHVLLAKTIIGNLDMAIKSQQDVVKFQIAINDAILVEVLECQAHLGSVEPESPVR